VLPAAVRVGGQYLGQAPIGNAEGVLELLGLLLLAVRGQICSRQDLVVENLLLRHQLAVLTRPTRTRPRPRLRSWDKLVCLGARPRRLRGMARPPGARHAGHGCPLAPAELAPVLALEDAPSWRATTRERRGAGIDRHDVAGQSSLWGTERIRGDLLTLGSAVSNRSIRR